MAKLYTKGIARYISGLTELVFFSEEDIKRAVYPAAGIVYNSVRAGVQGIPVMDTNYKRRDKMARGVTAAQKAGLLSSLGIARFKNQGGFINVKIGFDGYNNVHTKNYPGGQPNAMIANAVESGSSWRRATPFMAKSVRAVASQAEQAMAKQFDIEVKKHMK